MQTSLKELQKLGVDHIAMMNGTGDGQVDVTLGEGPAFAGGLTEGMFDSDPNVSFNLELDQEQLATDDLSGLLAQTDNLVSAGLDTSSVELEDGVHLDDIIGSDTLDQLQSLDGSLAVTLDVEGRGEEGSATVSDGLAHELAQAGIDFASADDLTVQADGSSVGTHLQTSLKELQKLGVDTVLLQGGGEPGPEGVAWTVDLGTGTWNPNGSIPLFGDADKDGILSQEEDSALDITLKIANLSDLGNGQTF